MHAAVACLCVLQETTLPPEVLFALLEGTVAQGQGGALGARHSPPPTQLPGDVREQQQQLQQLWAQLEGHIQEFDSLAGLVQGLAGSDVHPHAIDGAALRAAGQLPGAHSTAGGMGCEVAVHSCSWPLRQQQAACFVEHNSHCAADC